MAEVGETFQHLRRLVQRLNGELHKDVRLEISGQDIEIDKTILERITNPLTHLLRNSMDHGIETPQERIAAGKPPQGVIRLSAYHEVGAAVIEILDDGRGINRERLLEKARTRGIDVGNLRPQDKGTLDLIFHPGLSTSETVSNVSGRGVGMDVVKKTVEAMRGKLSVHSEPGRGTRITLRLPVTMALTMALIRGLQVRVDDVCIIIPMEEILTCGELLANTLHGEGVTGYLEHLGQRIPYIHLGRYLKRAPQTAPRLKMAIVQQGQQPIALLVHELQSEHQTVIKPMGPLLSTHPCFNGASILGDGTVAMVLNTNSLLDKISNNLQDAA
jgi:two-component system chemotaxis sensor kinase CheA